MIMIGAPLQNREKIIDRYLESIENIDYPKEDIHILFIVNNSTDATWDAVLKFSFKHIHEYGICDVIKEDNMADGYVDNIYKRDYEAFAEIRNEWLSYLDEDDTHFFSIDSDCLVPPQSLNQLLTHDKDICSIVVENAPTFYNTCMLDEEKQVYKSVYPKPNKLMQVDVTGAVMLVKREVIDAGVEWGYALQGEDIAFCESAKDKGFEVWSDGSMEVKHLKWEIHNL